MKEENQIEHESFRVVLISAPWASFHRPSIQLATLKAYLHEQGGYNAACHHLYLSIAKEISIELYTKIGASGWAGEALFSAMLFPEQKQEAAKLFAAEFKKRSNAPFPDFSRLTKQIKQCCDSWVARIDPSTLSLVGFSVCFSQLFSSLYLARQIKRRADVPIVFGGTSCSGSVGQNLLSQFSQIDFIVDGEGEGALLELCNTLQSGGSALSKRVRRRGHYEPGFERAPIKTLDDLPIPDFSAYFAQARNLFGQLPFMPILPLEFSRGCSWNRCSFCNLNLQWHGYRHKSARRMAEEVKQLATAHESLSISFTDNVLPPRETDSFFNEVEAIGHDYTFFAEIRARTSPEQLTRYHRGGLRTIQVGIEALSATLLARMGKGTTVMDNLAIMKYCSGLGITLMGNVITEFPGTTEAEIEETLRNLLFALPFAPLDTASFFLGIGSPIHKNPAKYGITAITEHPKSRSLFPDSYRQNLLVCGYRGDKQLQKKRWKVVRNTINDWQMFHRNRPDTTSSPLCYRDGGDYLVISQELENHTMLLHRLRGVSRQIYLYCQQPQQLEHILDHFPRLKEHSLEQFVKQLVEKRIMFQESDRILSLAVRQR